MPRLSSQPTEITPENPPQAAEDLIIERFKKIRLSDVSAEFHLLLERSRDGKRRRQA